MALLLLQVAATPAAAAGEDAASAWGVKWDRGFRLRSPDGEFELRFGGFFQADLALVGAVDAGVEERFGQLEDGSEFRRARLYFSGKLYGNLAFKAEYDFAGGDADFKDVYLEFLETPIGNLRIGHFKEPFSLELLTSDKNVPFIERALPLVFGPDRNMGLMLHDHIGDRFNWGVGAFRESDDVGFSSGDDLLNLTGRMAWRPLYQDGGRRLVHLGLSATSKDTAGSSDGFRIRGRGEVHLGPPILDTGGLATTGQEIFDIEVAGVFGRLWLAGEYLDTKIDTPDRGTLSFDGAYVQAGWFLTGERRPYASDEGRFDSVSPERDFIGGGGIGAWEVAVRFSTLDLTDAGVAGGEVDAFTAGLNWYPNPVARLMLNWVRSDLEWAGQADFFSLRAQLEF